MNSPFIADTVFYIGVNDKELNLFGGQSPVSDGVSCNSYVILDERTAVIHPANERTTGQWLSKLKQIMDGEPADYLVISHPEPGCCGAVRSFMNEYPEVKLVGNAALLADLKSELGREFDERILLVSDGSELGLGHHVLQFFMIPSNQQPELMIVYESMEELLFSADTAEAGRKWAEECRKRTEELPVQRICPMYGPLQEDGEASGSMAPRREHTGTRKSGFWKMFSGTRVS